MLWPFSNICRKSWIADAGLRAGRRRFVLANRETDACFIVRDANGRALAYVYCGAAAKLLTRDMR